MIRSKETEARGAAGERVGSRWALQDAKAKFSELVRRARSEGPQHVTVHGKDQVVVIAAEDYQRFADKRTGVALLAAMRACPASDLDFDHEASPMPVREPEF